jgi:carbonic anhydrase/acetyltransferase-like protein (isoleucine patch superfamily)
MVRSLRGIQPQVAATAYIDDTAQLIGDVIIGEHSSVWPFAVLRGDMNYIRIGSNVNIQDHCVVHVETDLHPTILEDNVGVGHGVILHGCRIESRCLIGMGAIVLNGAHIGSGSIVAAGALVPERTVIPPGSLFLGFPGKVIRQLTEKDAERIDRTVAAYVKLKEQYLAERRGRKSALP